MYLKRLELFGFKSFANKTKLLFEPGVTAIVGPNGCGKSNVADAIKWVLGEQSAKELRGSKMEDIIFNGTDNTQAVSLAEVSLILSNKDNILPLDYDEVIITRRVFRSGESEYLLNKTQVRLKDILDLLAGTGIGVSSYSIAEQGRMDRVLSARPEDRREIFEEASGITKYKTKKKEALLKLEHTDNNLTRIADIINEVRRQITSIERQAQKAEKFRVEFEKLKALDVKLTYREYSKVKDELGAIRQENEALKQKEAHLSLELNLQLDELRIHREKITALDEKISEARLKASNITGTIDKNENTIKIDRERIGELSRRSDSLSKEIEEILRRASEIKENINKVESELNLIDNEKENKQGALAEAEKDLNTATETIKDCEKTISDSRLAVMDNASRQSRLKNELNKILASLTTASSRHRRLTIEEENTAKETEAIEGKLEKAESICAEQKTDLEKKANQLHCLKDTYAQLDSNVQEKSQAVENLKQRLASSSSRLEVLKDLKDKKEGFSEGVKAYMEFIDKNPKAKEAFVGVVADILHPQEGFLKALESVLDEKSQLIIVKTRDALKEALGYLKSQRKGRAQFIALDELSRVKLDTKELKNPSIIGRLSDFVDVAEEDEAILRYILKDTYLVKEINESSSLRESAVLVTREGDLSRGIITSGGSSSREEYTSIIGRDAKIRDLSNEVDNLRRHILDYETEYSRIVQKRQELEKDLMALEEANRREEIKLNAAESEKAKIAEERDKLQQELNLIRLELEEITEEETDLKQRETSLKEELTQLEAEYQRLDSLINESRHTISVKTSEKEQIIVTLTELRTQISLVNDKYNSHSSTYKMLKDSLRDEEAAVGLRKTQDEEARQKSHSLGLEIGRLTEENKALSSQSEIVGNELVKLQEERRSAYAVTQEFDSKTRDKQRELDEQRNGISTFHINMTELNYKANTIRERIQQAYKVNLDEEMVVFDGDEDWEKIAIDVNELREKIERMGPVNLVAIDEHNELQQRYDFLTSQQEDLINAKESLHKAINKINRTTRKMFIETFEQIKVAFKTYFKLLFGGGTAELFLIDQADILESGIEIVVRPPGKKLQNISLLSGGERALTAIALLFALFKVRPTPFCVLDEIDAPLDEANIDRFSMILQEFVKTTQFLIITHNKKTIAVSDVMYGITMEKSGISSIVSVKFAEEQKAAKEQKTTPGRISPDLTNLDRRGFLTPR